MREGTRACRTKFRTLRRGVSYGKGGSAARLIVDQRHLGEIKLSSRASSKQFSTTSAPANYRTARSA
jgi:hypothetical protein